MSGRGLWSLAGRALKDGLMLQIFDLVIGREWMEEYPRSIDTDTAIRYETICGP